MPVKPDGKRFRATCSEGCARPLDWAVDTQEHADNVLAKHRREHHDGLPEGTTAPAPAAGTVSSGPDTVDLTAAARTVIDLNHAAAYAVWAALTDTTPSEARVMVAQIAESETTLTAAVIPF